MSKSQHETRWQQVEELIELGRLNAARQFAERSLARHDISAEDNLQTMSQLMSLAQSAADVFPGVSFGRIDAHVPIGWQLANPSIHPIAENRRAYVRMVNYRQEGEDYHVHDPGRIVHTKPHIAAIDTDLRATGIFELNDLTGISRSDVFAIRGFEDFRIFSYDGADYAAASIRNADSSGIVQQFLLTIQGNEIVQAVAMSGPADGHQKNWMPVVGHEDMLFVDTCYPKQIRQHDPSTGRTNVVSRVATSPLFSRFRGGSQLVPWHGGYLSVVHEVLQYGGIERVYLHRFVKFDLHLNITHCSDQFFLLKRGVEFCAGMRIESESVILSFGVDDRHAWLARISESEVLASLRSIDDRTSMPNLSAHTSIAFAERERSGIASVTLAHSGREEALSDALRSVVDHVDYCVVVVTDQSREIEEVAREVAGEKAIIEHFAWSNDFAAARNASLQFAVEIGAAWAVIVDSDEIMQFGSVDLAGMIADTGSEIHTMSTPDFLNSYTKVRLFRLPVVGRFVGVTHEFYDRRDMGQTFVPGLTFSERSKTEAESQHKFGRDLAILERETQRRPMETRWWYYLGDALAKYDRHHDAIEAYRRCADLRGWNEESAWACYKEAQSWMVLEQPDLAVQRCAVGMGLHPGIAELPWFAGFASWKAGRLRDAIAFSNLAIVHGEHYGLAHEANRISFRHFPALYEGPFDVLRFAYRQLGDDVAADQAERDFQAALSARLRIPGQQ